MTETNDLSEYARRRPQFFDDVVPPLLRECLARPGLSRVLDAGCGEGSLARALLDQGHLEGRVLTATDLSADRLTYLQDLAPNVTPVLDDIEVLQHVADGSVDLYISSQVIEHVDDAKVAATIVRVTHPGSVIYLSTVFKHWYGWYFHRREGRFVLDPTHVREYRRDEELLRHFPKDRFHLLRSAKRPVSYPIADFVLRRLGTARAVYGASRALRAIRRVEVPIVGYRTWELVFERTS